VGGKLVYWKSSKGRMLYFYNFLKGEDVRKVFEYSAAGLAVKRCSRDFSLEKVIHKPRKKKEAFASKKKEDL
jgi:hypothetical protein